MKSKKETQEYKKSLLKILDQYYQVDSFYMADILSELKQGKQMIDLLDRLEITNETDISLKFNFIGTAYNYKGEYDKE